MFIFYVTLTLSWWLTKLLWGDKPAKYSLFVIIPIGIICTPALWAEDSGQGILSLGFALSLIYAFVFVGINVLFFFISLFRSTDWKDPEVQRAFLEGLFNRSGGSSRNSYDEEYGSYVIQYRSGSTWIDGPGSNDERVAESMFDRFLENDPRGSKRCRLVYKVNGRVKSVLSTN